MITSLRLVNFKNFADETLKVGPFTVIVGANASGKSNIRDAFRFLHGIGRGYTLAEILGGKYGAGGHREWAGIRGATNEIIRFGNSEFSINIRANVQGGSLNYTLKAEFDDFRSGGFRVTHEELSDGGKTVYSGRGLSETIWVNSPKGLERGDPVGQPFRSDQPALLQETAMFGEERLIEDKPVRQLHSILAGIHFLDLVPDRIREPTFPGQNRLGDGGENLPSVLEAICTDSERGRTLMSWLQELTPMDVKDFDFPRDPSGRVHLHIVERNGRKVSAYSASDGTLRFLGILAALLNSNGGGLYFFEEIDSGIHPNRLWLLLDLIAQQTAKGKIQVVTTTHSPALLAWINDTTFEHTSVVYRDEYRTDSVIRPIAGLYNLRELRESQGLERLLTSGWFETAMKFSEGDPDTDHLDDDEDDWEQGVLQ